MLIFLSMSSFVWIWKSPTEGSIIREEQPTINDSFPALSFATSVCFCLGCKAACNNTPLRIVLGSSRVFSNLLILIRPDLFV